MGGNDGDAFDDSMNGGEAVGMELIGREKLGVASLCVMFNKEMSR